MRFNPPPNWPALPPGWTPPPGWQPDPSWPQPPHGWQLWVSDGPNAYGPPNPPTPNRTPWIIGGVVAGLAVAGLAAGLFFGLKSDGDSAEDQIRASMNKLVAATNDGDIDAVKALTCESEQEGWDGVTGKILKELTTELGEFSLEILSIDVTSETTAKVEARATYSEDPSFDVTATNLVKKESGTWKECGEL